MIPGYSPTDRPRTPGELQSGMPRELHEAGTRSAKGPWITLAVVVLVVLGTIMLLSLIPEGAVTTTTSILVPDAPVG